MKDLKNKSKRQPCFCFGNSRSLALIQLATPAISPLLHGALSLLQSTALYCHLLYLCCLYIWTILFHILFQLCLGHNIDIKQYLLGLLANWRFFSLTAKISKYTWGGGNVKHETYKQADIATLWLTWPRGPSQWNNKDHLGDRCFLLWEDKSFFFLR